MIPAGRPRVSHEFGAPCCVHLVKRTTLTPVGAEALAFQSHGPHSCAHVRNAPEVSPRMRRIAISVAATSMSVMLAGCGVLNATGSSDDESPSKGDDITIGLLLPEKANTRYEQFDYPIFKTKVESLTNKKGTVEYANAEADADK